MQDIFGNLVENFNFINKKAREIANLYCCAELQTPILEFASIFDRNLGNESDIVKKEIYRFEDRNRDVLALRPEFTAGVVRSLIENNMRLPCRLFSYGSLFRYDRPQKGRYRQFHQVNFESFGRSGWLEDCEMLLLAYNFLLSLGIGDSFSLELNSLGSKQTLKKYQIALIEYFTTNKSKLSALSLERLEKNPIRILDSKEEADIDICNNAPNISSFYSQDEELHFNKIQSTLNDIGVKFSINERIVRGLDYYTGMVFEFITSLLGSQSTILGGGRYDELVEEMGGTKTPAIGFAAGIERLCMLLKNEAKPKIMLWVLPLNHEFEPEALKFCENCRKLGIKTGILSGEQNVGKRLEKAGKKDFSNFAIIIGKNEIETKTFKLKNLTTGKEKIGDFELLLKCLK